MTIHAAGSSLSASQIFAELGLSAPFGFNANIAVMRELSKVPSGPVKFSDFYSKSAFDAFLTAVPSTLAISSPTSEISMLVIGPAGKLFSVSAGSAEYDYIDPAYTNLLSLAKQVKFRVLSATQAVNYANCSDNVWANIANAPFSPKVGLFGIVGLSSLQVEVSLRIGTTGNVTIRNLTVTGSP